MFLIFHSLSVHLDQALQMLPSRLVSPGGWINHDSITFVQTSWATNKYIYTSNNSTYRFTIRARRSFSAFLPSEALCSISEELNMCFKQMSQQAKDLHKLSVHPMGCIVEKCLTIGPGRPGRPGFPLGQSQPSTAGERSEGHWGIQNIAHKIQTK